jgi:hypothetical protein
MSRQTRPGVSGGAFKKGKPSSRAADGGGWIAPKCAHEQPVIADVPRKAKTLPHRKQKHTSTDSKTTPAQKVKTHLHRKQKHTSTESKNTTAAAISRELAPRSRPPARHPPGFAEVPRIHLSPPRPRAIAPCKAATSHILPTSLALWRCLGRQAPAQVCRPRLPGGRGVCGVCGVGGVS